MLLLSRQAGVLWSQSRVWQFWVSERWSLQGTGARVLSSYSNAHATCHGVQAQHAQVLQAQLDQLSAEVAAQRLALAAATSERDGARASAIETNERLRVSCLHACLLPT